ncbi:MAG: hypothetical protein ABL927_07780 [Bdellovibrionales bacterium]
MRKSRLINFAKWASIALAGLGAFVSGYFIVVSLLGQDEIVQPSGESSADLAHSLILPAKVISTVTSSGIAFGNLINAQRVCDLYSQMKIEFLAEGMAVNGERPQMVLTGPCINGDDGFIKPFLINISQVTKDEPIDREYEIDFNVKTIEPDRGLSSVKNNSLNDLGQAKFKIQILNLSDSWPKKWVLNGVTLSEPPKNLTTRQTIQIKSDELNQIIGKNLSLNWEK